MDRPRVDGQGRRHHSENQRRRFDEADQRQGPQGRPHRPATPRRPSHARRIQGYPAPPPQIIRPGQTSPQACPVAGSPVTCAPVFL